jgi:N-acyl-D-aspartate/D-glutamate deacylase
MARDASLIIRGGTLVDGTGAPPYEADIAIGDGRILEIGKISARGADEINAKGLIVTPGFVDIHTHYDAQATWSSRLLSSSINGVTTALLGNCGVGFAPCRPDRRDMLVKLMECGGFAGGCAYRRPTLELGKLPGISGCFGCAAL